MFKRLSFYLSEMFPFSSFVGTWATALALQLSYLKISALPVQIYHQFIYSGVFAVCLSLLLRVMDEFKDFEDDKKNFPSRPLPSGKVLTQDLKILGWFCVALMILTSLMTLKILLMALTVLSYAFLMLKWFFIEKKMRQSLPLALISHHPIVFLNILYLLFYLTETIPGSSLHNILTLLPVGLIFTNWEVSRKIRSPQNETEYTTYSKILGPRLAILICLGIQSSIFFTVYNIFQKMQSPSFISVSFYFFMFLSSLRYWQFALNPSLSFNFKKWSESQILLVIFYLLWAALW